MRSLTLIHTPTLPRAAEGTARAGGPQPVAEIVTFRLNKGCDPAQFIAAAEAMEPFLTSTGAVTRRILSVDAEGLWTDHIEWTSMDAAKTAAEQMMMQPEAGPFMAMIDGPSATMRHAPIYLRQE